MDWKCEKCGSEKKCGLARICGKCYRKKYREANPEKLREINRKWREANPEKNIKAVRRWQKNNPEKVSEYIIRWQKTNPEKTREYANRRRVRESDADGFHTTGEWIKLRNQMEGVCPCCGINLGLEAMTVDHIIPLSKGGSDYIENIQPLCLRCNISKNNHHSTNYIQDNSIIVKQQRLML